MNREARQAFATSILNCPDGHTIWLDLYDGPTPIVAVPGEDGKVVIQVSKDIGMHFRMTPELAIRLARHLMWAATEIWIEKPVTEVTP